MTENEERKYERTVNVISGGGRERTKHTLANECGKAQRGR